MYVLICLSSRSCDHYSAGLGQLHDCASFASKSTWVGDSYLISNRDVFLVEDGWWASVFGINVGSLKFLD